MADPSATASPSPGLGDLLSELERLVPGLPTTTLLELAGRLAQLTAEEHLQPDQVENALLELLDGR